MCFKIRRRDETDKYQVGEASVKVLSKAENCERNFGLGRDTAVAKLNVAFMASETSSFVQEVPERPPQLFKHEVATLVLHDFMCFLHPQTQALHQWEAL